MFITCKVVAPMHRQTDTETREAERDTERHKTQKGIDGNTHGQRLNKNSAGLMLMLMLTLMSRIHGRTKTNSPSTWFWAQSKPPSFEAATPHRVLASDVTVAY